MNLPNSDYYLSIISTKQHPYKELIAEGKKKAEGRVYTEKIRKFSTDKTLCLYNNLSYVLCRIIFLKVYKSFEEMLLKEGVSNMLPFTDSLDEALKIYKSFPGSEKVKIFGAVAIVLEPIIITDHEMKNQGDNNDRNREKAQSIF